ncbi:hypothetical protein AB4Y45_33280 [Paraburkholderia sp. EG287A]|uniref:hypothetical protein n=1 Tax=Paraburkholderia sp. EG287A TaxID=3237012 RepID=UPI0034D1FA17
MKRKLLLAVGCSVLSFSALAQVGPDYLHHEHERGREEIGARLQRQGQHIDKAVVDGVLTTDQAIRLQEQDDAIAHRMVQLGAMHGGHLTFEDVRMLNHDLDEVAAELGASGL